MDSSKEFQLMLNRAIESEPLGFEGFDQTKNVQDQLQAMVRGRYPRQYLMIVDFAEYCVGSADELSLEQLWLGFAKKKLYNKVWSGIDWIKEA